MHDASYEVNMNNSLSFTYKQKFIIKQRQLFPQHQLPLCRESTDSKIFLSAARCYKNLAGAA